jgi:hypothetical protein
MGVFEFVIILVIITTIGKVAMAVGAPMVDKLGDIAGQMATDRQGRKQVGGPELDPELIEELERRLARIEDRLDFLEELKAPERRRALGGGLERGARHGATGPGTAPGPASSTDEDTAGAS